MSSQSALRSRSAGHDVLIVLGAGPGIGGSVARRFAAEGYSVGLVARTASSLERMAADLTQATGVAVATAIADATEPAQVRSAIGDLTRALGPATALCFSPLPDVGLIKPVLDTSPEEFMASLGLNVAGAAAAVSTVLPAMQERGRGSLLFTTGSAGLRPDPNRAASAVTTTAASVYISLVRQALSDGPIRVGHTVVAGPVGAGTSSHHPDAVAEDVYRHHDGRAREFPTVLRLS